MKIMIVDDDEIALNLLANTLKNANYNDIITVSSAREALNYLDQSQDIIDCFMLDIIMPEIDGVTLCKMLRETDLYARVPIMMVSSLTDQQHIDCAFAVGATDYISKPFNGFELGARVRAASALSKVVKTEEFARVRAAFLTQKINNIDAINLAERFDLESVAGACDLFELENTLLKMPDGNHPIRMLAFKILDVANIHKQLTSDEFRGVINIIANCINNCINSTKLQIAYAGNGTYICTEFGSGTHAPSEIEKNVKEAVHKFQMTDRLGDPIALDIVMGRPVNTNFWSSMDAAAGIEKALHRMKLIDSQDHNRSTLVLTHPMQEAENKTADGSDQAYH